MLEIGPQRKAYSTKLGIEAVTLIGERVVAENPTTQETS
jgi:hypothetical protein